MWSRNCGQCLTGEVGWGLPAFRADDAAKTIEHCLKPNIKGRLTPPIAKSNKKVKHVSSSVARLERRSSEEKLRG